MKANTVQNISVDLIDDPEFVAREIVAPEKLDELEVSIKKFGVIQPIIVEKHDTRYRVVAGNLRLMACRRLSLPEIPCIVRQFNKKDKFAITLHENLIRSDMTPIELAHAFVKLRKQFNYTNEEIGSVFGKSQGWVSGHLGLLHAEPEIQEAVESRRIDVTSANTLMRLPTRPLRMRYLQFALNSGATQSVIRDWVNKALLQIEQSPPSASHATGENLPETPPPLTFECSCCHEDVDQNKSITLELCPGCFDVVNELMKAARKGGK